MNLIECFVSCVILMFFYAILFLLFNVLPVLVK